MALLEEMCYWVSVLMFQNPIYSQFFLSHNFVLLNNLFVHWRCVNVIGLIKAKCLIPRQDFRGQEDAMEKGGDED